ncbi:hypothetical protein Dimus_015193 [Dionaea muscipula]
MDPLPQLSMAAVMATMSILPKTTSSLKQQHITKPLAADGISIPLFGFKSLQNINITPAATSLTGTTLASAFFVALSSSCEPAMAVQQIAEIAQGDNRGLALLLPIIPAIGWVLFNILQPALNQINRMRTEKAVIIGLGGLGGLAASGFFFLSSTPDALAAEIMTTVAEASSSSSDSRGRLLLFVILPAVAWVLYNILQPALNQINRMRSQ